jgi:hypothetical protein
VTAAFARITDLHDQKACLINPCARLLYRWLLRRCPAGKIQEFYLSEFQNWSAQCRRRPYCTRQIRRALFQLIDQGMVGQVKKYYSVHGWRLAAYHPDETEMPSPGTKPSDSDTKKSKTQPSNLHLAVPSNRENYKEISDTHPPHPAAVLQKKGEEKKEESSQEVMVSQPPLIDAREEPFNAEPTNPGEEKFSAAALSSETLIEAEAVETLNVQLAALVQTFTLEPCPISESRQEDVELEEEEPSHPQAVDYSEPRIPEIERKLYLVEDCGIKINAQLEALVRDFTLEEVKNATAYLRQTKRTKEAKGQKIDRPAGWLTDCLRQSWWKTAEPEKTKEQEEFEQWYKEAIASGLVENVPISRLSLDRYGQPLVRQRKPGLFGMPYTLMPWRDLLQTRTEPAVTTEESDNDGFKAPY